MYNFSSRKPNGYVTITDPDTKLQEFETIQCVHCGGHFIVQPGSGVVRGYCYKCMGPVCGARCEVCVPTEKWLEQVEKVASRDYRYGL